MKRYICVDFCIKMAKTPRDAVDSLRMHIGELTTRYTALMERCEHLDVLLQEKEKQILCLQEELERIHARYKNLAMAQTVALQEGDVTAARSRFEKLVREIDKCISLLNE